MSDFIKELKKLLSPFKSTIVMREDLNYILLPVNRLELNEENVATVNEITQFLHDNSFKKIKRTPSGGISIDRCKYSPAMFDIRSCGSGIEITIVAHWCLRIQLGACPTDENGESKFISGSKALKKFTAELKKDGVKLQNYKVDNGEEINSQIRKPRIKAYAKSENINEAPIFENAHHLDFHKAYMSGLYLSHPEMQKTIQRLYDQRHDNKLIKAIFTNTIGKMHSSQINWQYANLAKDAINTFNDVLDKVALDLVKSGRKLLAYNTDGIWYTGDIYHGEFEGANLGQWENDYTNCKIRFKSDGAYEFINDGKYYAKVRGRTRLDKLMPRDQWSWGDIFKLDATPMTYVIKDYLIVME